MAYDRCFIHQSSSPCSRRKRRQPGYGLYKRRLNTKIHLAVDSLGMPFRVIITAGTVADSSKADELIEGFDADYLLTDRGYDTERVIEQAVIAGMEAVIAPKKDRKTQQELR